MSEFSDMLPMSEFSDINAISGHFWPFRYEKDRFEGCIRPAYTLSLIHI